MFQQTQLKYLIVRFIAALTCAAFAEAQNIKLQYGDGVQDGKRSMTGAGHAVRFECPDEDQWYLSAVAVHGSRYGTPKAPRDKFSVLVASEDLKDYLRIPKPYSLFDRGETKWVKFNVPPVKIPKVFQVGLFFNPTRSKGVYVGIDEDSSPTHSMTIVPDDASKNTSDLQGDWMIRAYVTKKTPKTPRTLGNANENAAKTATLEAEREAKLLGKARSITLKHDQGATEDHLNVGGAAYTVEFETPKNVEAYVWETQVYASQFGGRHDAEAVSADVYVLDEHRKVLSRTTFPYSLATYQKQWINIPMLPTRVRGKFYVSIDTHGGKTKGLYVGYATKENTKIASTDEIVDDSIKPAQWSSKFDDKQWLMRVKIADRPVAYGPTEQE